MYVYTSMYLLLCILSYSVLIATDMYIYTDRRHISITQICLYIYMYIYVHIRIRTCVPQRGLGEVGLGAPTGPIMAYTASCSGLTVPWTPSGGKNGSKGAVGYQVVGFHGPLALGL